MQLPSVKAIQKAFPYLSVKKREARQIREILEKYYEHPDGALYRISRILRSNGLFYIHGMKDKGDERHGILFCTTYEAGDTTISYDYEQRIYHIGDVFRDLICPNIERFNLTPFSKD